MIEKNLPSGYCRLCSIDSEGSDQPGNDSAHNDANDSADRAPLLDTAAMLMMGLVIVVVPTGCEDNENKKQSSDMTAMVCTMQQPPNAAWRGSNRPSRNHQPSWGLCFHHHQDDTIVKSSGVCVRLISWNDNHDTAGTAHVREAVRRLTRIRYRLSTTPVQQQPNPSILYDCPNPTNHCHARISNASIIAEDDDDTSGFLGVVNSVPVPLLSLTLTMITRSPQDNDNNNNDLFLVRLKRQIVGVCIVFVNQNVTTLLTLKSSSKSKTSANETVRLRVESVIANKKSKNQADLQMIFGLVMPSTRITILPQSMPLLCTINNAVPGKTLLDLPSRRHQEEPAATRILLETVRCLRKGSKKALVPKSFLLAGPPGVGKTFAVKQAYNICKTEGPTLLLSLGSMLGSSGSPSEVSRLLEKRFEQTARQCHTNTRNTSDKNNNNNNNNNNTGCVAIIFIDECDALLSSDHVAGMLASVLDRSSQGREGWQRLVIVAATNRVDSIPAYLRRPGRFDKEIQIGPPTEEERYSILETLVAANAGAFSLMSRESLVELAEACVGYVPADVAALVRRAFSLVLEEGRSSIEPDIFNRAMLEVGASALRDSSLSAPPGTSWDDIAGSLRAKTTLRQAIEWPKTKKEPFKNLGLRPPKGILLYGPPGCAKTTLARASAHASSSHFIALSPAEVYGSSYVGEAEAIVRSAFKLARSANPCILFFDEIDSILGSDQDSAGHGMGRSARGSSAESRVLSTFLNEMDGVDGSLEDGVLVLGATNRPGILDKALLRPGRFDKIVYVPPPDYEGRIAILKKYCDVWKVSNVDLSILASEEVSGSMTGAEIVGACQAAAMQALRLSNPADLKPALVSQNHLEESLKAVKPLLSDAGAMADFVAFEESCQRR